MAEKAKETVGEWWQDLRVGDGHFTGMGRKGFKELAAGLLPAFPHQPGVIEEIGIFGNPSQGEIAQSRGETGLDAEQEKKATAAEEQTQTAGLEPAANEQARTGQEQKSVLGYPLQQPPPEQGRGQDRPRGR